MREAAIRLAGWLYGNRPHVSEHEITDPSGTTIKLRFNNSARDREWFSRVRRVGASVALCGAPGRRDRLMWPFSRRTETREAEGGYTGIISALIGAQAAGTTATGVRDGRDRGGCGVHSHELSPTRALMVHPMLSRRCLPARSHRSARDLVRVGESLHVIRMSGGRTRLFPASTWYWQGDADPADWTCTATVYGPSGSSTWRLPQSSVVFVTWGRADRPAISRAIARHLGG